MGFVYGLAVVLLIFEGIIIQCEGAPKQAKLPRCDIDFKTIEKEDPKLNEILHDYIIELSPFKGGKDVIKYHYEGGAILNFQNYETIVTFFERFGERVKRISINYGSYVSDVPHKEVNLNIINRYAGNLEELIIRTYNDEGFWEEISNGTKRIEFSKVTKFRIDSVNKQEKFDLKLIFPNLKSFYLRGSVVDKNCLDNVNTLEELRLWFDAIPEHKYENIFKKNPGIKMISLAMPAETKTMQSIADNLKKLETFEVLYPHENFLLQKSNVPVPVFELKSVTTFEIVTSERELEVIIDQLFSYFLSFKMPILKKLKLSGTDVVLRRNTPFIHFINRFPELEELEVDVYEIDFLNQIETYTDIKKITARFRWQIDETNFDSLPRILKTFAPQTRLQTVKFVRHIPFKFHENFIEGKIEEVNKQMEYWREPTWTLKQDKEENIWGGTSYSLEFKRVPFTGSFIFYLGNSVP